MLRKLLGIVTGFFVLVVVVLVGGGSGRVAFVFGWALLGYVVWRAWPGIRADLGRARFPSGRGRFARSGGSRKVETL